MTIARIAKSFGMMLIGIFFIAGCADDSPVAPMSEQNGPTAKLKAATTLTDAGTSTSVNDNSTTTSLTRIVWPCPNQSATDLLMNSVYVTPTRGGTVSVKWSNYDAANKKTSTVSFSLTIPAGAVSSAQTISITVDKNAPEIAANFGPEGLVFLTPALLDVKATGIDISALNATDQVDLWYVNATGWVGTMQSSKFTFSPTKGTLTAAGIQIPHFSRYCFGR